MNIKREGQEPVRCRCCFQLTENESSIQESSFKDHYRNLRDTFNIKLSSLKNEEICSECARRLLDAKEFKELVLQSEKRHLELLSRTSKPDSKVTIIKIEPGDNAIEQDHSYSEDCGIRAQSPELELKVEDVKPKIAKVFVPHHSVARRPLTKPRTLDIGRLLSRADIQVKRLGGKANQMLVRKAPALKAKSRNIEAKSSQLLSKLMSSKNNSELRIKIRDQAGGLLRSLANKGTRKDVTIKKIVNTKLTINKKLVENEKPKVKMCLSKNRYERQMMRQDVFKFIAFTTAMPFVSSRGVFKCLYCCQLYPVYDQLHSHVTEAHADIDKKLQNLPPVDDLYTLDITDLKCRKCEEPLTDITDAKEHLISKHKMNFKLNEKGTVIQFKLLNIQGYKCHLCPKQYHVYRNLSSHMNEHFPNYMCEVCGLPLISEHRYNVHALMHIEGTFPCSKCKEVFKTVNLKNTHEAKHRATRYSCPQCNEKFAKYPERMVHLTKVHQVHHKMICPFCNKEYTDFASFKTHKRKHTARVKRVVCPLCDKTFCDKQTLAKHNVTHTGERPFECKVCGKCYGRKNTLREHMRIHENDRRHVCSECGMTFVQKCSLKGHMKSRHPNVEWVP